jgi:hypothetical protein
MEQDLPHAVCGDLLLIATLLSMLELARRSTGQRILLVHRDRFQQRF